MADGNGGLTCLGVPQVPQHRCTCKETDTRAKTHSHTHELIHNHTNTHRHLYSHTQTRLSVCTHTQAQAYTLALGGAVAAGWMRHASWEGVPFPREEAEPHTAPAGPDPHCPSRRDILPLEGLRTVLWQGQGSTDGHG